jgi:hypothetical protein
VWVEEVLTEQMLPEHLLNLCRMWVFREAEMESQAERRREA